MVSNRGIPQIRNYFGFALVIGFVFVLGWVFWNLFIVTESSVGFTNRGSRAIDIYKITIDGNVIYNGSPKRHEPNIRASRNGDYFYFSVPHGKLDMRVYFLDDNGRQFTASHELDHRTGRYIFWCDIDNHYALNCGHDDIFDFAD
ncbi:hypothetical protein [Candidatus Methylocalor cossyra]